MRRPRSPRDRLAAWIAALAAVAFVLGLAHAGSRFFYCAPLGELLDAPCCTHARDEAKRPALDRAARDCCEAGALGALPSASTTETPGVPGAAVTALVGAPSPSRTVPLLHAQLARRRAGPRAGPSLARALASPTDARSALMVFLI